MLSSSILPPQSWFWEKTASGASRDFALQWGLSCSFSLQTRIWEAVNLLASLYFGPFLTPSVQGMMLCHWPRTDFLTWLSVSSRASSYTRKPGFQSMAGLSPSSATLWLSDLGKVTHLSESVSLLKRSVNRSNKIHVTGLLPRFSEFVHVSHSGTQ